MWRLSPLTLVAAPHRGVQILCPLVPISSMHALRGGGRGGCGEKHLLALLEREKEDGIEVIDGFFLPISLRRTRRRHRDHRGMLVLARLIPAFVQDDASTPLCRSMPLTEADEAGAKGSMGATGPQMPRAHDFLLQHAELPLSFTS